MCFASVKKEKKKISKKSAKCALSFFFHYPYFTQELRCKFSKVCTCEKDHNHATLKLTKTLFPPNLYIVLYTRRKQFFCKPLTCMNTRKTEGANLVFFRGVFTKKNLSDLERLLILFFITQLSPVLFV